MKLLSLLLLTVQIITAQNFSITFQVNAPAIPDTESVYIAGNQAELGNWNPSAVKLDRTDKGTWRKSFSFPVGTILEYKFTRGAWDNEALNAEGSIPQNHILTVTKDTLITIRVNKWRDEGVVNENFKGQITGAVKYHRKFKGKGLLPRDVIVWLPPGYESDKEKRYPVLYMHDGQNLFDPSTSSFGVDWQADETADSLIRNGEIEPLIIVGVYNTSDRSYDYVPGKKGTAYMNFLINKLKPFIDKNYRTLHDRENTAVAGSSLGGLISFMLGWEHPDVFSKAGCFSPAFIFNKINYVEKARNDPAPNPEVLFYIDNGGVGLDEKLQWGIDEMLKTLENKGLERDKDYVFLKDKNARHFEAAWAKRFPIMLKLFFGN